MDHRLLLGADQDKGCPLVLQGGRHCGEEVQTLIGAGIVLITVLGGAVIGGPAGARSALTPVGPKQSFVGLVNRHSNSATVQVLCPGPLRQNQTGKPVAGRTVGIATPSTVSTAPGFTGTRAHSIMAEFTPTPTVGATTDETFTVYGSLPIPTSVQLPCTGTATFSSRPCPRARRLAPPACPSRFGPPAGRRPVPSTAGIRPAPEASPRARDRAPLLLSDGHLHDVGRSGDDAVERGPCLVGHGDRTDR